MKDVHLPFLALFGLAGCASTQLNSNTLDLASKSGDLFKSQLVYNLSNYVANPLATPAQIEIDSGTASTSNSITPTFTFPLSAMSAVAGGFSTASGGSATGSTTITRAGGGGSVAANDSWTQSYIFETVTDNERFARLNAIYESAVDGKQATLDRLPPIHKTFSLSKPVCVANATGTGPTVSGTDFTWKKHCISSITLQKGDSGTASVSVGTRSESFQTVDGYYSEKKSAGCITCKLTFRWLHWRGPRETPERLPNIGQDTFLGSSNGVDLYVAKGQEDAYRVFAEAVLWAMNASTASSAAGGGGGGGGPTGGTEKQKPLYNFSVPLGAPGT